MDSEHNQFQDIFECQQCGQCCRGFGGTYVTDQDIQRISAFIRQAPEGFINRYCDPSGSRYVLTCGKDGYCIFFDAQKQCTIHPVKPYMCRAWPFIHAVVAHPENWDIMAGSCIGMKKNIPHTDLIQYVTAQKKKLDESITALQIQTPDA